MTDEALLALAEAEGFHAAMIAPRDIPVNPDFRMFCAENRCGKYGANYSCPPDCGTPEEMHANILAQDRTMIIQTIWPISGFEDRESIQAAKKYHNAGALRILDQVRKAGYQGFAAGYNGCPLCDPCKAVLGQFCAFPDKRISCLSAYCVDVAKLAQICGLPFAWSQDKLHLFGMIAISDTIG